MYLDWSSLNKRPTTLLKLFTLILSTVLFSESIQIDRNESRLIVFRKSDVAGSFRVSRMKTRPENNISSAKVS